MKLEDAKRKLLDKLAGDISDGRVLDAMRRVPRERFVPSATYDLAYEDIALKIAADQTVSQPTIVALMVEALELRAYDKVLEVGTGSGYQAAILAEIARCVVTVERIPELSDSAKAILDDLGYRNIKVVRAGRDLGCAEEGPYNAIVVAAAAPRLPSGLIDQLEIGGRLVVPVGSRSEQTLMKVVKGDFGPVLKSLGGCRFVPLIAEDAWPQK